MMFPPPITMASSVPMSFASATCRAIDATIRASMPKPCCGSANDSPDSLSRTRLYLPCTMGGLGLCLAYADAGEAPDGDVLAHRSARLVDQLRDRLVFVLDPLLVEKDVVLVERLELAADDLLDDVLGLAGVLRLLGVDRRLL